MKKCKTCKSFEGVPSYTIAYAGRCHNDDAKRAVMYLAGIIYLTDGMPQSSEHSCVFYEPADG